MDIGSVTAVLVSVLTYIIKRHRLTKGWELP